MKATEQLALSWSEWADADSIKLAELIAHAEITAAQAARQASAAIAKLNPTLQAVLETFDDIIETPDKERSAHQAPLYGVPMLLKDLSAGLAGRKQEAGSALYKDYVATQTDPIVENFLAAGLIPVGRSTTPEFGLAWDTTTNYLGRDISTRNPFNTLLTAGGSSGGSAAAVAAGMVPIASSSDGGGSTRIPASLCGLVGLKPSRGLCPRPYDSSEYLSRISTDGVITRSVRDTAAALDYMARVPKGGSFTRFAHSAGTYSNAVRQDPKPLRIAVSTGTWGRSDILHPSNKTHIDAVTGLLASLGHDVKEVSDSAICNWSELWESYTINWIANRALLGQAAEQRGIDESQLQAFLTPMTYRMYEASAAYDKFDLWRMMQMNNRLTRSFGTFLGRHDVLLTPVYAISAPPVNNRYSLLDDEPIEQWFDRQLDASRYAIPANEVGLPAIAIPTGLSDEKMPVGVQFYGSWGEEALLLQLAAQVERARPDWFGLRPRVHVCTMHDQ